MADQSTHDDVGAAGGTDDDFDLSAEDHSQDNSGTQDSPDDDRTTDLDEDADNSASSDDADDDDSGDDSADDDSASKTPAFDADLKEWAQKTGRISADEAEELSDRELKLLQDVRNGQREFSRNRQSKKTATDLQAVIKEAAPDGKDNSDTDDVGDPLEKEVKEIKDLYRQERTTRLQSEYFAENGVTEEEVATMGEILKEKVDRGGQKALEYWTDPDNLNDWHDLAKLRLSQREGDSKTSEVEAKVRDEERKRLAKISKSSGPSRSAKGTTPAKKEDELTALWKSDD